MSLFNNRYIFVYKQERSREYLTAGGCAREGFEKVLDHPFGDGWTVATDGNEGALRKDPQAVKDRVKRLLETRPVGTTIRVNAVKEDQVIDTVRFRKALVKPPVKDTRGPIGLDRVEGFIEDEYPNARFAGDCVCKPASDHRDCAAVDYFDSNANMIRQKNQLLTAPDYFDIKYIILFDTIYFPNGSSRPHTGTFHAHIHVSVNGGEAGAAC